MHKKKGKKELIEKKIQNSKKKKEKQSRILGLLQYSLLGL